MKILALDLGKYKTVGCDYERESDAHRFRASFTTPAALQQLVKEVKPDFMLPSAQRTKNQSLRGLRCDVCTLQGADLFSQRWWSPLHCRILEFLSILLSSLLFRFET